MERKSAQRRLAAILAADVVGYTQLMSVDEMGTLTSLKAHRRELIDPAISGHHGRIVKTTGDGALVEFGSVVDAVQCAVAIQRGMLSRNAGICEDKRIVFRIGVNVGDIIIDSGDIFGDGVNIAARLQTFCEPGGLCISRAANDQIRDKLALAFADLGEQTVKNISRAIGVFGLAPTDIEGLPEAVSAFCIPRASAPTRAGSELKWPRSFEQNLRVVKWIVGRGLCCRAERQRVRVGLIRGAAVKGCVRSPCVVEGDVAAD